MANQVRIEYDPYHTQIFYNWRTDAEREWGQLTNSILTEQEVYQKSSLQSILPEVIARIDENYNRNKCEPLEIVFCGTDEDYEDFGEILATYYSKQENKLRPVLKRDEVEYRSAVEIQPEIDEIMKKLRQEFDWDDAQSEVQSSLARYHDIVSDCIPICVIGPYSTGKSMFINALIGEEILPSGTDPETARVYKIVPSNESSIDFQYGNETYTFRFPAEAPKLDTAGSDAPSDEITKLFDAFADENYKERRAADNVHMALAALNNMANTQGAQSKLGSLICVNVPFYRSPLFSSKSSHTTFEIYDTPGSAAAKHEDHLQALKQALQARSNGLPILLTEPNSTEGTALVDLSKTLHECGTALDTNHILLVVNKADTAVASVQTKSAHYRNERYGKSTGNDPGKPDKSVFGQWKSGWIFFVSSIMALGSKKESEKWFDKDARRQYLSAKLYSTQLDDELYISFPQYDILPEKQRIKNMQAVEAAEQRMHTGNETDIRELITQNSGIRAIESEICRYAERHAAYHKCAEAVKAISTAIDITKAKQASLERAKGQDLEKLIREFDEKQQKLLDQLKTYCAERRDTANTDLQSDLAQKDNGESIKELSGRIKQADIFNKKDKKKEILRRAVAEIYDDCCAKYSKQQYDNTNLFFQSRAAGDQAGLLKIINESDAVTEQEKIFLKAYVLSSSYEAPEPDTFDIRKLGLLKTQYFLFFNTGKMKLDIQKCLSTAQNIFRADSLGITQKGMERYIKSYTKWIEDLHVGLAGKLAEFNSELKRLHDHIKETEKQITILKQAQERLEQSSDKVDQMMSKQTSKEDTHESIYE